VSSVFAGQPNKWYLVDREVTSPHTSCFYRSLPEQISAETGYDAAGFDESATYWYNGAKRTARAFTSDQEEARLLVREFVRVLLAGRERHPFEYEGPWDPNVAVANCYRGSKEVRGPFSCTRSGPPPLLTASGAQIVFDAWWAAHSLSAFTATCCSTSAHSQLSPL
jgi:hypothetical protein